MAPCLSPPKGHTHRLPVSFNTRIAFLTVDRWQLVSQLAVWHRKHRLWGKPRPKQLTQEKMLTKTYVTQGQQCTRRQITFCGRGEVCSAPAPEWLPDTGLWDDSWHPEPISDQQVEGQISKSANRRWWGRNHWVHPAPMAVLTTTVKHKQTPAKGCNSVKLKKQYFNNLEDFLVKLGHLIICHWLKKTGATPGFPLHRIRKRDRVLLSRVVL